MAFIKLASTDDIKPGKMARYLHNGVKVLLCNVDGSYYAISDTCTHEDFSLSYGALHGEVVKCSLHGGKFNVISGEPVEEPACTALRTFPVELRGHDIYVDID